MSRSQKVIDAVVAALKKHDPKNAIQDHTGVGITVAQNLEIPERSVIEELLSITGGSTLEEACQVASETVRRASAPDVPIYDLREEQAKAAPKTRVRGGQTVQRDPRSILGIVIHQTAIPFGISDAAVRHFGGDRPRALADRALNVACHAMAFREGFFAVANKLTSYVYHGHGLNSRSLGLEIDGRYPGLMDDPETAPDEAELTTWRGEPMRLDDRTLKAARAALRWLVETGRSEGMPLRYIWAHRQSSPMRRSDPGEEIWRRVVLDYAVPELGLVTQPNQVWKEDDGTGYPIPLDWDPDGVGRY